MLYVEPVTDSKVVAGLASSCELPSASKEVAFVLYEDGEARGLAFIKVGTTSVFKSVGILPAWRGRGYGDFLTRTMLFKLSEISETLQTGYQSEYFEKFGFVEHNGRMSVAVEDLQFPSTCGK